MQRSTASEETATASSSTRTAQTRMDATTGRGPAVDTHVHTHHDLHAPSTHHPPTGPPGKNRPHNWDDVETNGDLLVPGPGFKLANREWLVVGNVVAQFQWTPAIVTGRSSNAP